MHMDLIHDAHKLAATQCNTLHTATRCSILQYTLMDMDLIRDAYKLAATHCNTLQHTAAHCNTLQHTATYCNINICIWT